MGKLYRKDLLPGQCFKYVSPITSGGTRYSAGPIIVDEGNLNLPSGWAYSPQRSTGLSMEVILIPHYLEPDLKRCDLAPGDYYVLVDTEQRYCMAIDMGSSKTPVIRVPKLGETSLVIPSKLAPASQQCPAQRTDRLVGNLFEVYCHTIRDEGNKAKGRFNTVTGVKYVVDADGTVCMTPYEINRAQTEWSRQLREKVNASKLATETKERMQVVVDWGDYWD